MRKTEALISQIYFCQEILYVSDSSSAHHHEFSTAHSTLVYIMHVWWQLSSTTRMELHPGRAWKLSSKVLDIYQCRMYSWKLMMMGRGTVRNI